MPITPRTVTTPASAVANWASGVQNGGNKWATGYANPSRNPFDPTVINPNAWQAGVSTAAAKDLYAKHLASVDQTVVLATVNGAGKTKYTTSGTTKQGKVLTFQTAFLPRLSTILTNLNTSNPKGPRGTNRARLNAYLDAVELLRGTLV